MSYKIDYTTIKYYDQSAVVMGAYIDSQGNSHNLYKRYVSIGGISISPNGGFTEKTLNLQGYTILHTSGLLYRSDVPTVISIVPGGEFGMVWTNSGQTLRIVNNLSTTQSNATLRLELVYID